MRIDEILKEQQPEVYKKLKSNKKGRGKENLSFSDVEQLMKRDSYYRGKGGAIKQK